MTTDFGAWTTSASGSALVKNSSGKVLFVRRPSRNLWFYQPVAVEDLTDDGSKKKLKSGF